MAGLGSRSLKSGLTLQICESLTSLLGLWASVSSLQLVNIKDLFWIKDETNICTAKQESRNKGLYVDVSPKMGNFRVKSKQL